MPVTEYLVNTRPYTCFLPIEAELSLDSQKNYLFDLAHLTCLSVLGDKGRDFLQGQLSCDIRDVTSSHMRQGVMCTLKGRVLALLDVLDWNGLKLILPQDLSAQTQVTLAKAAALSRVTVASTSDYHVFGFYAQNQSDLIPFEKALPEQQYEVVQTDGYCCYNIGHGYYLYLVNKTHITSMKAPYLTHNQWRGSLAWHALQLHHHTISIYPSSQGLFLPHRLDLQLSGYLSFNKGCYKGQEIIARMHYRATRKHKMSLFYLETDHALQSGVPLFDDAGIEIGELIDFCPTSPTTYLCAASVILNCPPICYINEHMRLEEITLNGDI
jgi:tRNA-modifying protein YgfZ